eukprot:GEZU01022679.1.p1 GENE.GEZU01022679.1~~GEZU01022679.1.p1  ORF type:complete len:224 (-),score=50.47 GEZU01022679.1:271-918(-)
MQNNNNRASTTTTTSLAMEENPSCFSSPSSIYIWTTEEAEDRAASQLGTSACGPTAVLNALWGLGFDKLQPNDVMDSMKVTMRDYKAPLGKYLESRTRAGTIHSHLIDAAEKLTDHEVMGFFFPFAGQQQTSKLQIPKPNELSRWLYEWMSKGGCPIATENLQVLGKHHDCWHHQMIYGVDVANDKILVTNNIDSFSSSELWSLVSSPSYLKIPR